MYNDLNIEDHLIRSRLKLLRFGWQWQYEVRNEKSIVNCFQHIRTKELRKSLYVFEEYRNKGVWKDFNSHEKKYITLPECELEPFFKKHNIDCVILSDSGPYYNMISEYYGSAKAKRSGVPYINHIDEGCGILYLLGASDYAKYAFMVHPIHQSGSYLDISSINIKILAEKYTNAANAFLRNNYKDSDINILKDYLSCEDTKNMLIADKIQNYKDFKENQNKYAEKIDIEKYFLWWFDTLEISHSFLYEATNYISGYK